MSRSARAAVGENAACSLWSGCGQRPVPGIASTGRAAIAVGALQQVAPRERARQVACRQRAEVDWLPVPQTQSAHRCGEVWSCAQISWPLSCCGVGVLACGVRSWPGADTTRIDPVILARCLSLSAGQCLPPPLHTRRKGWGRRMLLLVARENDRAPFPSIWTY